MKKPILVVMAAGMGSRYGGLKQIDPIGANDQLIIDYSIYDARRAGFETVVFIIKKEIEDIFRQAIGDRLSKVIEVRYAFQEKDDLPHGYTLPHDRVKPWGTAHAVLAARHLIDAPFVVINADDYYGPEAFRAIYQHLSNNPDNDLGYQYAMVGYRLDNTVTQHGHVARGICIVDDNGSLCQVRELTRIEQHSDAIRYTEDDGNTWNTLADDAIVSMNLWGFHPSFLTETMEQFPAFLDDALMNNPLKGEYFLPSVVSNLIQSGKAQVKVLSCSEKWYGVTYQQDKPVVVAAIAEKTAEGLYPLRLWEDCK